MIEFNDLMNFGGWAVAFGMFVFEIIKYNSSEKRQDRKEMRDEFKDKKDEGSLMVHLEYIKTSVSNIENKVGEIEKEIKNNKYDLVAMKEQIRTLFKRLEIAEGKIEDIENGKQN